MTTIDKHAARGVFEQFLFEMDDKLEALQEDANARSFNLDFSLASLAHLERYIDAVSAATPRSVDLTSVLIACGRYLGEVVRVNYGGKWDIPLDDPADLYFNQPVIIGHNRSGTELAPLFLARAYQRKRKPGMIAAAIENQINPKEIDLSDLVAQEESSNTRS